MSKLVEYIKLHKLSLEQDTWKEDLSGAEYLNLESQISVLDHILNVAQEFDNTAEK